MLAILRDGRKLIGVMRSYDQFGEIAWCLEYQPLDNIAPRIRAAYNCMGSFELGPTFAQPFVPPLPTVTANLVFQDTVERTFVGNRFTDVPKGIYVIRGENVVMLGEVVSDSKTQAETNSARHVRHSKG